MKRLGNFLTYKGWIEDSCPGSLILEPSMPNQHTYFQSLEEKSFLGAHSKGAVNSFPWLACTVLCASLMTSLLAIGEQEHKEGYYKLWQIKDLCSSGDMRRRPSP